MPWKETMAGKERLLLEWEKRWENGEGRMNFSELCRELGVSRDVGYSWLRRYRAANNDVKVAGGQSRRPHTSPTKVADELEDAIAELRKVHPSWGPKKAPRVDSPPSP